MAEVSEQDAKPSRPFTRKRYLGTLLFNLAAFSLPALYATLSKLWVADIDSDMVATTDTFTYIGIIVEVINEGLPRAAWTVIGDKTNRPIADRHRLSYTLILVQSIFGLILSVVFVAAAEQFSSAFVPREIRHNSLTYVRIAAFSSLASAIEYATANATRALDQPDVPLLISSVKFIINIILDMILVSKFHVHGITPTVNTQAATQLACGLAASFAGLAYFLITTFRQRRSGEPVRPSFMALKDLAKPGVYTFAESAIRNALYAWLVSGIVKMGLDYTTAWGVFNTIRWGLVMVPVQALEATSLVFVSHAWGRWQAQPASRASLSRFYPLIYPPLLSCLMVLIFEVPICLGLSFSGAHRFAQYLSGSIKVSLITQKMWKSIDWCYIFYAVSTQMATLLLATRPRWYLYQSLISNLCWVLPWAIVMAKININPDNAWSYHAIVFGGSLVFSFADILIVDVIWAWRILRERRVQRAQSD
ncbi:hypothetical protein K470DRAFT_220615 [Piedraia hortae CBS 480.64]|uniref:Uncharacterized protein n=1 Tax=Piedraia hortae CBS 480.64 TaxID=1314780 RepID=A0A6A7BU33_9PEZI|nr:hypothetical protein K470DRAFT_220615 [Piedraia hortae CBS 480.64]